MNFVTVAVADSLTEGYGECVEAEGHEIALFRVADGFRAVENRCPHYGASLCEGYVRNGTVMCPWHGWEFDLTSGECQTITGCNVKSYPVRVEAGNVQVGLEDPKQAPTPEPLADTTGVSPN